MIDLAPLLGRLVGAIRSGVASAGTIANRGHTLMMVASLVGGLPFGLGGPVLAPGRPIHGFGCRHCLVGAAPIGSRGYATGVEFAAH